MPRISLPDDNDALLAECEVETFRSGGPGGQHANKVESGVRLSHGPSGIVVTILSSRSQHRNKQLALEELRNRLDVLNKPVKKRVATKPSASSKRKRLDTKRRRGEKKARRKKPGADE